MRAPHPPPLRAIVPASFLAAAGALAGCGSNGVKTSADNNCGAAYTFTVGGRLVGSPCGGVMPEHATSVKVQPGGRFSLVVTGNSNGTRPFPVPKPTGSAVVITRTQGQRVEYEAKAAGQSRLAVRSKYCPTDPKVSTCTVLVVSVG